MCRPSPNLSPVLGRPPDTSRRELSPYGGILIGLSAKIVGNPSPEVCPSPLTQTKDFSEISTFSKSQVVNREFETVLGKVIWRNAAKLLYFCKTNANRTFPGHQMPPSTGKHPSEVVQSGVSSTQGCLITEAPLWATSEGCLPVGRGIWWPGDGVFTLVWGKYNSFAAFLQITFARTV